jgi:hypothetical protein
VRRKLFNFAAFVSLALCVGTASLWARSYWIWDRLSHDVMHDGQCGHVLTWDSSRGEIAITVLRFDRPWRFARIHRLMHRSGQPWRQPSPTAAGFARDAGQATMWIGIGGVRSDDGGSGSGILTPIHYGRFLLPMYAVFLCFATLPLYWLASFRRIGQGCCESCGYDLTGNTSGVCPECATLVADKAGAES